MGKYRGYKGIVHELYEKTHSRRFEKLTGIPPHATAAFLGKKGERLITLNFLPLQNGPVALEERIDAWVFGIQAKHRDYDFATKILTFDEYCSLFQERKFREEESSPHALYMHVLEHKDDVLNNTHPIYAGVQIVENGDTLTVVDFAKKGMIVKVDESVQDKHYRSKHRARKNNGLKRAQRFFERHGYGPVQAIRLDGVRDGDGWQISLVDSTTGSRMSYQKL